MSEKSNFNHQFLSFRFPFLIIFFLLVFRSLLSTGTNALEEVSTERRPKKKQNRNLLFLMPRAGTCKWIGNNNMEKMLKVML